MRTAKNLCRHELIGLKVRVSGKSGLSGLAGKIVDETMSMLVVEAKGEIKKVPKKGNEFTFPEYDTALAGEEILARPEDRIKN